MFGKMKVPRPVWALVATAGVVLLAATAFAAGAILQPVAVQKAWVRLTARTAWEQNHRLGRLLHEGMTPDEVTAILGPAETSEQIPKGVCWRYWGGGCAGNELVLQFSKAMPGKPMLSYVHQDSEAISLGLNPECYTIGTPLRP